ncbi:MAG: hypothetical protein IJL02_03300 [Methanobrevibacter sp.]|uniref:hypothetical protein n=1 Tax=Methanobrevibacter sp. TaxID=66852 RepID=UPI0025D6C626|nr:hypothetical protein [Methanobrevibacter sp.]MBQ6098875.1 hypothetical protein [Methanobrevibacter sp.]
MANLPNIQIKPLVFGAAIAAAFILFGWQFNDWLYPFSAIGLLYAGYGQENITMGTIMGAVASTPIIILFLDGYLGQPTGFFITENGIIAIAAIIIIVGALVGFVGAWTKRSREKAKEEYEKKQNIGKNKTKKKKQQKKADAQKTKEKTKYVDKIFKK